MNRGLALSFVSFVTVVGIGRASADVETRMIQPERGDTVNEDVGDLVAPRPHNDMIVPLYPSFESAAVTSNTIFMNKCTGGCTVTRGVDDSRTQRSSIIQNAGTLPAFPYSADAWTQVMTCLKGTFAPFNVVVTDVDPGSSASHLEVLIGGNAPSAFGSARAPVASRRSPASRTSRTRWCSTSPASGARARRVTPSAS